MLFRSVSSLSYSPNPAREKVMPADDPPQRVSPSPMVFFSCAVDRQMLPMGMGISSSDHPRLINFFRRDLPLCRNRTNDLIFCCESASMIFALSQQQINPGYQAHPSFTVPNDASTRSLCPKPRAHALSSHQYLVPYESSENADRGFQHTCASRHHSDSLDSNVKLLNVRPCDSRILFR